MYLILLKKKVSEFILVFKHSYRVHTQPRSTLLIIYQEEKTNMHTIQLLYSVFLSTGKKQFTLPYMSDYYECTVVCMVFCIL